MEASTLEQYFIEDYKRLKAENEEMRIKLAKFEANSSNHEYGITDLHQQATGVRGSTISPYTLLSRLKDGKLKVATAQKWVTLSIDDAIKQLTDKYLDYSKIIEYTEQTFQYTLMVKESRVEWVAVTEGHQNDILIKLSTDSQDIRQDVWYDVSLASKLKAQLVLKLQEDLKQVLEDYDEYLSEKGQGD